MTAVKEAFGAVAHVIGAALYIAFGALSLPLAAVALFFAVPTGAPHRYPAFYEMGPWTTQQWLDVAAYATLLLIAVFWIRHWWVMRDER